MSEIKIPKELLNVIADINFDEIQSQSYSPSHFRSWLCAWHEKIKTELYDFANNHELYQQGRADEQLRSIESAKEQAKEYRVALEKAKLDGARKFLVWYSGGETMPSFGRYAKCNIDDVIAEWQKGTANNTNI